METERRQTGRDLQSFKERQHELDLLHAKVSKLCATAHLDTRSPKFSYLP